MISCNSSHPALSCGCMSNVDWRFFVRRTALEEILACKGTLDIGFVWFFRLFSGREMRFLPLGCDLSKSRTS